MESIFFYHLSIFIMDIDKQVKLNAKFTSTNFIKLNPVLTVVFCDFT